ncbi:MAG: hypothetical protein IJ710_03985 [Prevotella sp.]|nr:hypothetical protein [Prevotella sp.]
MKIQQLIGGLAIAAAMLLTGCAADSTDDGRQQPAGKDKVTVRLRVTAADGAATRAWVDAANATDDEMMNVWTVVVADATTGEVKYIHACRPTGDPRREVDDYVELTPGSYKFYSFANMAPSVVMQLLGIDGTGAQGAEVTRAGDNGAAGDRVPTYTPSNDDTFVTTAAVDKVYSIAFDAGATVAADIDDKTVGVKGNGVDITAPNNFGAPGIPMSNVQTKTVTADTELELIVVRMFAKIELRVQNATGNAVNLTSVTLTDVTGNTDGNLKLLPQLSDHDTMDPRPTTEHATHLGTPEVTDFTLSTGWNIAADATEVITFYINESETPPLSATNKFRRFFLKLQVSGESEYRYALIDDQNATGATGTWDYIARNDYRVIPVVLDDYRLDILPFDFPPIGVYPASVKEEDGLYTINFHDYGHFHLVPLVTRISTGTAVPYGSGTPDYWTLDGDWSAAWSTWTDATKTTTGDGGFYVDETPSPAVDADDNGGHPVLDVTTTWNGYTPFIFGKIADPGAALSADRTAYHELTVLVHKSGGATRQLLGRIYMRLDTEQMLYAAPARSAAPRRPHGH